MSKKLNTSGGGTPNNTLFKYFARSPATIEKNKIPKTPTETVKEKENLARNRKEGEPQKKQRPVKRKLESELPEKEEKNLKNVEQRVDTKAEDDEDEVNGSYKRGNKKRRRARIIDDSEEEEEPQNGKSAGSDNEYKVDDDENGKQDQSDSEAEDTGGSHKNAQKKNTKEPEKKKAKLDVVNNKNISLMEKLKQLQETPVASSAKKDAKYEKLVCSNSTLDEPVVWPHQKLEFLKPDKIKDKQGRRPEHPDYDATTLYVPNSFKDILSPGVRQWWDLKSGNYDCVLFFKVGKFYELYHMDADVGVKELGFTYMRGEFAHSGFPEVSFDKMASILVDRGYKIARVEQTETPDMMTERCKQIKATKFDKVVRREICQITSKGTQVYGSQCRIPANHQPNYMLALVERDAGVTSNYGIAYIDTSLGDFYLGEFEDDKNCSRLLTLLSHHMPVLLLYEKAGLSERTLQICRTVLGGVHKEMVPVNGPDACSAEKTLKQLAEGYYASSEKADNWPLVLRAMQSESDHLGLTPHDAYKLALKALGQCMLHLGKCYLSEKVLPMARYHLYMPPDIRDMELKPLQEKDKRYMPRSHMVLDATTLQNLRITGEEHSLQATLDTCCTKFGKRLLHHWLCAPSCELAVISERQDAIIELRSHAEILQNARGLLAPLPDFERQLAQIHLFGNKAVMSGHPDGRAIFFEEKLYNKKKIQNFIAMLRSFETLKTLPTMFKDCSATLLKRLTQLPAVGVFPEMHELLEYFKTAFNHAEGAKTGVIAPKPGVDEDYDNSERKIGEINAELTAYLVKQEIYFGCRLCYFGTHKKRFQLEVPESNARKAGKAYQLEGQRKSGKPVRRFSTNETRELLKQMQHAEDERNAVLKDLARRIFEKFSTHYELWKCCVDCVGMLDVLCALAEYARNQTVVCVPLLELPKEGVQPDIEILEGYHPCVPADVYISNGITLGADDVGPLSLLTGPNMGGKSTLMRQMGLIVVMAQIGALVPAKRCRLSIVDRIFTRLGAQDDILAGQSTFLVELNETSLILKHATRHSLVLLDELGRGTATYDGTAIAVSVVNFLADLQCRTIFSTHYHNLVDYFRKDSRITLGHMACMVEHKDDEDPTQGTVTFLYVYAPGACPKSYGFNAAKLAGMPRPIVKRAYELSKTVEAIALRRKITAKIVAAAGDSTASARCNNTKAIKALLLQLNACRI